MPSMERKHITRRNGMTEVKIVEAITQLAFYTGWPNAITAVTAVTAVTVAREGFNQK